MRWRFVLVLLLGLMGCARSTPVFQRADAGLPVKWAVPSFAFVDQDGQPFTDSSLRGQVWIADYIYTQCAAVCPTLSAQFKMVQRQLLGHAVHFVSFSIDPDRDSPATLKAYARQWSADETRWRFVNTTSQARLHEFLAAMHTEAHPSDDPASPFTHSERFVLIDATGLVRGAYDSTSRDELKQLVVDAMTLADAIRPPAVLPTAPVESGRSLVMTLGCMACHSQARLAPGLEGLLGSSVTLADERKVTADKAYIRESILDPVAKVVAGYAPIMPPYELSETQVDALVAYIESISSIPSRTRVAHATAIDPVCHMQVTASDDALHATSAGKTYYFCSDGCRTAFLSQPSQYLGKSASQ